MADKIIGGCVRTPCPDAFCRNDWTRNLYWLRSCVHPFGNYVDHQGRETLTNNTHTFPTFPIRRQIVIQFQINWFWLISKIAVLITIKMLEEIKKQLIENEAYVIIKEVEILLLQYSWIRTVSAVDQLSSLIQLTTFLMRFS